jgi:hypothetical protein
MSDSYIERAQARFSLGSISADRLRRAGELVANELSEPLDQRLLGLYAYLALTTGSATTREGVHDAWAVWRYQTNATHRSQIPFEDLTADVQARDQPYVDAIHRAARAL